MADNIIGIIWRANIYSTLPVCQSSVTQWLFHFRNHIVVTSNEAGENRKDALTLPTPQCRRTFFVVSAKWPFPNLCLRGDCEWHHSEDLNSGSQTLVYHSSIAVERFNRLSPSRRNPSNSCMSPLLHLISMTWETHYAAVLRILSPVVKFRALYSETTACSANSFTVHCPSSSMYCWVTMATDMTGQTETNRPLRCKPAVGTLPHLNACTHLATAEYCSTRPPNSRHSPAISGAENSN